MKSARVRPSKGPEGGRRAVAMLRPGSIGAAGQPDRPAPAHADDSRAAHPMFLTIQLDDDSPLVEVLDLTQLFDPFEAQVLGRLHAGEELQDPQPWPKAELRFPSGEALPGCWLKAVQAVEEGTEHAQEPVAG